jgi:2-polyprenyl-3-methyl-5-hydroxy-6-metoxy-1,4-benzoquinol methylase
MPADKAMEVGPGSGVYQPHLSRLFADVTAIDIEQTYLDHVSGLLQDYPNITLLIDNITHSSQESATYDLILCTEVIEHIPDSAPAITEMHRLLKPSGVLVLSTPQRYSLLELTAKIAFLPGIISIVRWIYNEPVLDNEHINLLTEADVLRQLSDAGFVVVEHYRSGLYIPLIAEFTGEPGRRFQAWLEEKLRNSWLSGWLWTQYFVAKAKPE